jgi:hypothetical protein
MFRILADLDPAPDPEFTGDNYILNAEKVSFEVPPRYSQEDHDYANLVWLGTR